MSSFPISPYQFAKEVGEADRFLVTTDKDQVFNPICANMYFDQAVVVAEFPVIIYFKDSKSCSDIGFTMVKSIKKIKSGDKVSYTLTSADASHLYPEQQMLVSIINDA